MKAIINTNIVMPDHIIRDASIVTDNGHIVAFGAGGDTDTSGLDCYDAQGAYTGPGLIEIHTHSDGETLFYDDPVRAAHTLLRHGVTDLLPALYFDMDKPELLSAVAKIKQAADNGTAPNIIGLYMEAPYLNPKFGANKTDNPWSGAVSSADYAEIIEAAGKLAKVWCIAPERPGIEDFVRDVKRANPGVVFSVAHSEASPPQTERLMKYGLRLATHHTNATGTLSRYPECRGVCVDETVLYNSEIYAELICDRMGIHVDPYMLRLVKKIKGDERIILISDAFTGCGITPAGYDGVDDINFDITGEICGTRFTLDRACRNMMTHTGASLCEVFRYASQNPARLLSLADRGSIGIGMRANLVTVDDGFNVGKVMLNGNFI